MASVAAVQPHQWVAIDDVLLSLTIPGRISDDQWDRYVDAIGVKRPRYCLILTAGAVEIDTAQRRRFTQMVMRTHSAVLVVTDNRITRGWAMAVGWFGAKLDAYAWHDLARAIDSFEVGEETRQRLYDEALRFHAARPTDPG